MDADALTTEVAQLWERIAALEAATPRVPTRPPTRTAPQPGRIPGRAGLNRAGISGGPNS